MHSRSYKLNSLYEGNAWNHFVFLNIFQFDNLSCEKIFKRSIFILIQVHVQLRNYIKSDGLWAKANFSVHEGHAYKKNELVI